MNFPELAIYLVAGRGSRLGDMTAECPKCLIPINGVPLLTRSLRQLSRLGVKKVILVIGYISGSFQDHYGSSYMGMEICYVFNPDWSTTNNLVSFDLAVLPEPIILSCLLGICCPVGIVKRPGSPGLLLSFCECDVAKLSISS